MHKKLNQTGRARLSLPAESSAEFEFQQDGEVQRCEDGAVARIIERVQKLHEPLDKISSKMDQVIRGVGDGKQRVAELEEHSRATAARVAELEHALEKTLDRLEDLEHGKLFSKDILIVGLEEGTEGPEPVKFFATWVPDVLGMHVRNNRIALQRARRTGPQKRADGEPRAVLLRFHSHRDKRVVLEAARDKDTLRVKGRKVSFRDFSFTVQKKRAETTKAGFKHSFMYPAQVNVLNPPGGGDVYLHPVKVEACVQSDTQQQEPETEE